MILEICISESISVFDRIFDTIRYIVKRIVSFMAPVIEGSDSVDDEADDGRSPPDLGIQVTEETITTELLS